jgi:plasmid stabilization system protein ParE
MERRDVAIADDPFGMGRQEVRRDLVQKMHTAIAAAGAPEEVHRRVREGVHEVGRAAFGRGSIAAIGGEGMRRKGDVVSPGAQRLRTVVDHFSVHPAGGREDSDIHGGWGMLR